MPAVAQYQAFQFSGFENGLNIDADSSRLQDNELARVTNFRLGRRGEMQMRTGYTRYDSNLVLSASFVQPWRSFASVDHIVVVTNDGEIWEDTFDGVFSDSGFNTNPQGGLTGFGVGFAPANKKIYVSGRDIVNVVGFDGAAWAAVPSIPNGKHLLFRHDRLFSINTTATPSRLFFSEFLQPEVFAVGDFIDFNPDDGFEINAAVVFGDDLMIFKDKAIWKMSGRDPASFSAYRLDTHRGCVSARSIDQIRGKLVFFDRDTGVWTFDGASFELVSQPINDYILAGMNYDLAYLASAYVGDDRYYISIPWGTGPIGTEYRTFVMFADTGGWTEYDTGFNDAVTYLGDRYQGHPGADGLYKADSSSNVFPPSVSPLAGSFRTPWVRVGGSGFKARIRRLEMTLKADVGVDAVVNMYRDYDETTIYKTRTFQGGSVPYPAAPLNDEERVVALDGWGNRVHAVQFEVLTSETPFQINDMTVFYTGGVDLRGER